MGAFGSKLRRARWDGGSQFMHFCPGCEDVHAIRTDARTGPKWAFNGNADKPTFHPSVRVFVEHFTDDDDKPLPAPVVETLCHYFIVDGQIAFCADSPHKLAGQTVDLPDWPYAPGTYGGIED